MPTGPSASAASWAARRRASPRPPPMCSSRWRLFDPIRTAATGRRLGIESDARTRFERGLDPDQVLSATEYATRLILELCGGEAAAPVVAGKVPARREPMTFRTTQLQRLTGIELEPPIIREHLAALGFAVAGGPAELDRRPAVLASRRHDRGLHRRGAGKAPRLRQDRARARWPGPPRSIAAF